jgi:hypothetical protein
MTYLVASFGEMLLLPFLVEFMPEIEDVPSINGFFPIDFAERYCSEFLSDIWS